MRIERPEEIKALIAKLKLLDSQKESAVEIYKTFFSVVGFICNRHSYQEIEEQRSYSPQTQVQILDELDKVREALVSAKLSSTVLDNFDLAYYEFVAKYNIRRQTLSHIIKEEKLALTPAPVEAKPLYWVRCDKPLSDNDIFYTKQTNIAMSQFIARYKRLRVQEEFATFHTVEISKHLQGVQIILAGGEYDSLNWIHGSLVQSLYPLRPVGYSKVEDFTQYLHLIIQNEMNLLDLSLSLLNEDDSFETQTLCKEIDHLLRPLLPVNVQFPGWLKTDSHKKIKYHGISIPKLNSVELRWNGGPFNQTFTLSLSPFVLWHDSHKKGILKELKPLVLSGSAKVKHLRHGINIHFKDVTNLVLILDAIRKIEEKISVIAYDLIQACDPKYISQCRLALLAGNRKPQPGKEPSNIYNVYSSNPNIADAKIFGNIFSFAFSPAPRKPPVASAASSAAPSASEPVPALSSSTS